MRNDIHSTSRFLASDYTFVLGYALGTSGEPGLGIDCTRPEWDAATSTVRPGRPHHGDACCVSRLRETGARFAPQGGTGRCTVCGAALRFGEVWRHAAGEHVHIGWECADKYGAVSDSRDAALAYRKAMAEMRSTAAREKKLATARDAWLAQHPATATALEARNAEPSVVPGCPTHNHEYVDGDAGQWCAGCERAKRNAWRSPEQKRNEALFILRDLYTKLHRYGSLSAKQEAFAASLAARVAAPIAPAVEEKHVAAPTGRVTFEGRVLSVKEGENAWGTYRRFTVVIETPEGTWLANGNVPSGTSLERGDRVRVKATLEQGSDAHFAFAKRPVVEVLA